MHIAVEGVVVVKVFLLIKVNRVEKPLRLRLHQPLWRTRSYFSTHLICTGVIRNPATRRTNQTVQKGRSAPPHFVVDFKVDRVEEPPHQPLHQPLWETKPFLKTNIICTGVVRNPATCHKNQAVHKGQLAPPHFVIDFKVNRVEERLHLRLQQPLWETKSPFLTHLICTVVR